MLQLLLPFQRLFVPVFIVLLLWGIYRTIFKRDRAVGLVLYLGLVIIVDNFLNTAIFLPGLEYGSIRYSEICALYLMLINPKKGKAEDKNNRLIFYLIIMFFFLLFVSGLRADTVEYGMNNFRRHVIPQIVAFLVAYKGFEKKEDYERFFLFFMILIIIIALFTFWDLFFDRWILKSEKLRDKTYFSGRRQGRFGSFFLNPNRLGAFAVLFFPVVFVRAIKEKKKLTKIFCWVGVLALAFAFVETQSRAAMLGFLISFLVFMVVPVKNFSIFKKLAVVVLFLFVFFLFIPGFFEHSTERFTTLEKELDEDSISRMSIWMFTLRVIKKNPFGVGLGENQYIKSMLRSGFESEYGSRPLDNPHNSYLQIAIYAGIPALLIFILMNALLVLKGISLNIRGNVQEYSLYIIGMVAGILGFLATAYAGGHMFYENVVPGYWLIVALLFSMMNSGQIVQKE